MGLDFEIFTFSTVNYCALVRTVYKLMFLEKLGHGLSSCLVKFDVSGTLQLTAICYAA